MATANRAVWDNHYGRQQALQQFPDENVVRFVRKNCPQKVFGTALDLGCGTGRHLPLLAQGFTSAIGCDFSAQALALVPSDYPVVQAALPELPFADGCFALVLAWGVLHYLNPSQVPEALAEIRRVLTPHGSVFLTLRSDQDTHLKKQIEKGDLQGGSAQLYSRKEAYALLSPFFASLKYGFILRQPLGEEEIVAHHMFHAQK